MSSESPDQLFRDAIDDRPEVGAARNDIVELHLPCRRCRRINEARRGASQRSKICNPADVGTPTAASARISRYSVLG